MPYLRHHFIDTSNASNTHATLFIDLPDFSATAVFLINPDNNDFYKKSQYLFQSKS